ncbi:MAG: tRNA lysidine(34) synthetase TilS [Deltaproteobacteria bacterium CG2_30_43_15]|nr:MAG: tRNA lysidine(34) synthetase TilS [Deltaproteobacteria bacterium CG2_30_43_15]
MMLISKVRRTIEKYSMLEQGDKVVVGVSGGPDSVFLLHTLKELREDFNLTLIVAHLDHCIRGVESKMECRFVEDMANRLHLPFEAKSVDVPALKKSEGASTQQAARDARYEFFMDTLKKFNAQKVALGHNADDQAETVLMRLIRGAGNKGLCGIPPIRDGIFIRPLIETRRSEIEGFLRENRIESVIDSSNRENVYLRNKVRNNLMPILMKEYNPGIVQNLIHTSEILRKEDEFLEKLVLELFPRICVSRGKGSLTLNILYLKDLEGAMQVRVLRKAVESFSGDLKRISFKHLESVMKMLSGEGANKSLNLPRGIIVEKRYTELIIRREIKETLFYYSFSEIPHCVRLKEIGKEVDFKVIPQKKHLNLNVDPNVAFMDYGQIKFPIVMRNFREGDRFQPMGMEGTKKLKDFFIDNKIPKSIRREIPLLLFDNLIAWVMGIRIDNRVMVRECPAEILQVRIF